MYKIPVIAVLGHKDSGKTTVIETLLRGMIREGYRVATAKHINRKGFSLLCEGKDTWRHSVAGANPVISVSDIETAIMIRDDAKTFSLNQLFKFVSNVDLMLLEGFSWIAKEDEHVGKIICVRSKEEYESYKEEVKGEIIAFCSSNHPNGEVLDLKKDASTITGLALKFIMKKRGIAEILSLLPGLDCGKCGYSSCEEMAVEIYNGKANLKDCAVLEARSQLRTRITINDVEIPIQPFVSKIIRNAIIGMISSLKGVSIKGDERLHINISK